MPVATIPGITELLLSQTATAVRDVLKALERLANSSPETIASQQLAQLQGLLTLRASTTLGHKKSPQGVALNDWNDWARLPLTTRAELQKHGTGAEVQSVPPAFEKRGSSSTSGSTGKPLASPTCWAQGALSRAVQLQFQRWHGFDLSGTTSYLTEPGDDACRPRKGRSWSSPLGGGSTWQGSLSAPVQQQLRFIQDTSPEYLVTYPSNLQALLRSGASGSPFPGLKYVVLSSEPVSEELMLECKKRWGAQVLRTYSSNELGPVALEAPDGDYAVIAPVAYVEILNDAGEACAPGTVGRIVVSSLHNLLRPLLRYETGDYGAWSSRSSAIFPGYPRITRISGRERSMVQLPDGRRVWPYFEFAPLLAHEELSCWQVAQLASTELEVRLVVQGFKANQAVPESLAQAVRAVVAQALPGLDVSLRIVDQIPRSRSGKFQELISELAS